MIIVVEGPNNVGKTTFINELLERLPKYKIEHTSNLTPNDYEFYKLCLTDTSNVIYDRLHVGEMVYPTIYKRERKITDKEFIDLIRNPNIIYVFVDADFEFIIQACYNKKEIFDLQITHNERKMFDNLANELLKEGCEVVKVNNHLVEQYDDNTTDIAIDYIITRCKCE